MSIYFWIETYSEQIKQLRAYKWMKQDKTSNMNEEFQEKVTSSVERI